MACKEVIFDKILSGNGDDATLSQFEQTKVNELIAEISHLSTNRPQLSSQAVELLKLSITESKNLAMKKVDEMVSRFASQISALMQPPMSEAEIASVRDQQIANILEGDSNPAHVEALKNVVDPLLIQYRKVGSFFLWLLYESYN